MRRSPFLLVWLASALAWTIIFVSVPPSRQEFPLNDDWAFTLSTFAFARGDGIHYSNWASMPQLGQWLWACPFLWRLGESHFALRVSTVVLSWLGLWGFYDVLRHQGCSARRSAVATACLAFNPLFFLLSGTYMTDVPALSFALMALALYVRALGGLSAGPWLAAAIAAMLAGITRQNGIVVPVVALGLLCGQRQLRVRLVPWLAIALPIGVTVITHVWFQHRADVRALHPDLPEPVTFVLVPFAAVHLFGLSALPLLIVEPRPGSWSVLIVATVILGGFAWYWHELAALLPYRGGLFPYTHNMLSPWGAFEGGYIGQLEVGRRPLVLGHDARLTLTVLGCLAGGWLIARAMARPAGAPEPLLWFAAGQLAFLLVAPEIYDRYLLPLLPAALYLAAIPGPEPRMGRPAALVVLAAMGLISVALMHDWLAWNAARWALGQQAVDRGINPWDIEGGFEWDGWFAPGTPVSHPAPAGGLTRPFNRDWFSHVTGRYALAFSVMPGTVELAQEPYTLWLPPGRHDFYLIEQKRRTAPHSPRLKGD